MEIKAEEISKIIREQIDEFRRGSRSMKSAA